jgi:copper homeostasis protein
MPKYPVLEICVESLDRAVAAERGGADRIELCANLAADGLTPGKDLMQTVRRDVHIAIHILIRPRVGDFLYSKTEFEQMKREIGIAKDLGMNGIVLGLLDEGKQIDQKRTTALIKLADPLPVTFHRAFDLCWNLADSLQLVIDTGAERVLTSGGKARAADGLKCLANLVAIAEKQIAIMPGGGVRAHNIERILVETGAREVHSSLETNSSRAMEFEARVRNLRSLMKPIAN